MPPEPTTPADVLLALQRLEASIDALLALQRGPLALPGARGFAAARSRQRQALKTG